MKNLLFLLGLLTLPAIALAEDNSGVGDPKLEMTPPQGSSIPAANQGAVPTTGRQTGQAKIVVEVLFYQRTSVLDARERPLVEILN